MPENHSAEFLRGWLNGLREQARECTVVINGDLPHVTQMSLIERADEIRHLPAEAEAREASEPTAAEVIEVAEKALVGIEWFLDAGVQESSMAPRYCSVCGKVQVEGKPAHGKNCNAVEVKDALDAIAKWKEAQ